MKRHCVGCALNSSFTIEHIASDELHYFIACVLSVCCNSTVCVLPYIRWLLGYVTTLSIYGLRDASGILPKFHLHFAHFHYLFFNFLLYFSNIVDTCKYTQQLFKISIDID